jgi:PleD family two-component response regulator
MTLAAFVANQTTNGTKTRNNDMILAVLDDLMFASKIRTTAAQVGIDVTFARSADAALAEMRNARPALVILDLNNQRINPLSIVRSMKQDPALTSVPTVGYASHVQTDVINAARQAGVDDVLARSAFATRLSEILRRA